jgi:Transposase DDE domain
MSRLPRREISSAGIKKRKVRRKRDRKERRKRRTAALDSTMLESRHVSRHYEKRQKQSPHKGKGKWAKAVNRCRSRVVKHLPKLSLAINASSHLILAARASTGTGSDSPHFVPLMLDAARRMPLEFVLADAGFDSEDNHRLARQELHVRSIIPATIGRPGANGPSGHYRRLMRQTFKGGPDKDYYGQRWQVETVNSMIKRNLGSACRARTPTGRKKDMLLRAITHNIMILANL